MADLPTLYVHAPALLAAGERGLSTDARTGIQALERPHPPIPLGPGRAERRACASRRRGTLTLIAHVDGARGRVVAPSRGPTRTAEDFVAPTACTVASDPEATRWHCVTDHLHTPQSASVVRCVAAYDGIAEHLGHKEPRGRRKSMATRAAFLADPTPHIVCHSTPKHASWRNHIAMWCRILVRKFLKARQFSLRAGLTSQGVGLYGLLQCDDGQTVHMDVRTPTAQCLKESLFPPGCTRWAQPLLKLMTQAMSSPSQKL